MILKKNRSTTQKKKGTFALVSFLFCICFLAFFSQNNIFILKKQSKKPFVTATTSKKGLGEGGG